MENQFSSKQEVQDSNEYKEMDSYKATATAEGFDGYEDPTIKEVQAAWQFLYDRGMLHQLQGWFGRTAEALFEKNFIFK